jgi:hypothetical protein
MRCFDLLKSPPVNVHERRAVAEKHQIQIVDAFGTGDLAGLGFPFVQGAG